MDSPTPGLEDPISDGEALSHADATDAALDVLVHRAGARRTALFGRELTYSPKAFLPLTNLCRNRCDYCAFRRSTGDAGEWTMRHDEVERTLRGAHRLGCAEALFCLGDTPETAFPSYRTELRALGHETTVDYLVWAGERALELGVLPHTNAGILTADEMERLKRVNVSLGLMLENVSERLCKKGMPHHKAPDKRPQRRLEMLENAGRLRIPFTTGILVGIGETPRERVEALLAIRRLHRKYGHVQEVIVQNFDPHPNTPMADAEAPSDADIARAVALSRLILDDDVSVQAPPNLNPERTRLLVDAGIDDFGGISPLTPDYINPDRPWPHVAALAGALGILGFSLSPRLPIYDAFVDRPGFLDRALLPHVRRCRERLRIPKKSGNASASLRAAAASAGAEATQ